MAKSSTPSISVFPTEEKSPDTDNGNDMWYVSSSGVLDASTSSTLPTGGESPNADYSDDFAYCVGLSGDVYNYGDYGVYDSYGTLSGHGKY